MMKQKGLQCHPSKTVCIIIGTTKYRKEANKEIKDDPVMFGEFKMNFVESEIYFGDVIYSQGLEDSCFRNSEPSSRDWLETSEPYPRVSV